MQPTATLGHRRAEHRRGLAAVLLSACLFGTAGTAAALGPDVLGPQTTAAWRTLIGGLALLAVSAVTGQAPWRFTWRSPWLVVGALALTANQITYFAAIDRTGVAYAALVTVGVMPLTAGVLDRLRGHRPRRAWITGVLVSLVGVGLLTGVKGDLDWLGVLAAATAGVAASVIGLSTQHLLRDRPLLPAMATIVCGAAALLLPVTIRGAGDVTGSFGATATVTYLGIFTMAGAFALWGTGLRHLTLGLVTAVSLLEPAIATVLAATLLAEPLTVGVVAGTALVLSGISIASRPQALT